eukprot:403346596
MSTLNSNYKNSFLSTTINSPNNRTHVSKSKTKQGSNYHSRQSSKMIEKMSNTQYLLNNQSNEKRYHQNHERKQLSMHQNQLNKFINPKNLADNEQLCTNEQLQNSNVLSEQNLKANEQNSSQNMQQKIYEILKEKHQNHSKNTKNQKLQQQPQTQKDQGQSLFVRESQNIQNLLTQELKLKNLNLSHNKTQQNMFHVQQQSGVKIFGDQEKKEIVLLIDKSEERQSQNKAKPKKLKKKKSQNISSERFNSNQYRNSELITGLNLNCFSFVNQNKDQHLSHGDQNYGVKLSQKFYQNIYNSMVQSPVSQSQNLLNQEQVMLENLRLKQQIDQLQQQLQLKNQEQNYSEKELISPQVHRKKKKKSKSLNRLANTQREFKSQNCSPSSGQLIEQSNVKTNEYQAVVDQRRGLLKRYMETQDIPKTRNEDQQLRTPQCIDFLNIDKSKINAQSQIYEEKLQQSSDIVQYEQAQLYSKTPASQNVIKIRSTSQSKILTGQNPSHLQSQSKDVNEEIISSSDYQIVPANKFLINSQEQTIFDQKFSPLRQSNPGIDDIIKANRHKDLENSRDNILEGSQERLDYIFGLLKNTSVSQKSIQIKKKDFYSNLSSERVTPKPQLLNQQMQNSYRPTIKSGIEVYRSPERQILNKKSSIEDDSQLDKEMRTLNIQPQQKPQQSREIMDSTFERIINESSFMIIPEKVLLSESYVTQQPQIVHDENQIVTQKSKVQKENKSDILKRYLNAQIDKSTHNNRNKENLMQLKTQQSDQQNLTSITIATNTPSKSTYNSEQKHKKSIGSQSKKVELKLRNDYSRQTIGQQNCDIQDFMDQTQNTSISIIQSQSVQRKKLDTKKRVPKQQVQRLSYLQRSQERIKSFREQSENRKIERLFQTTQNLNMSRILGHSLEKQRQ